MVRNLKTKELSTRVMVPFIVFAILVGIINIGTSEASGRSWKYSYRSEDFFRAAIYINWMNNDRLKGVDCDPKDVKFIYYDFGDDDKNTLAEAGVWGAYKDFKGVYGDVSKKDYDFNYCTIKVNTRNKEIRKNACITMIHEYGHLLGYGHSKNPDSVMFSPYDGIPINKQIALQVRNQKYRLSKSICSGPGLNKI